VSAVVVRSSELMERARSALESATARDVALLGARVGLAWSFIYHGSATLFGAFGGAGLSRTSTFFATVAHLHPGTFFATMSGIIELFGGAAVGLGVLGRLAAVGLVGDMAIAMATVTFRNGIVSNAAGSGYEINVALGALAFAVALLGTGRLSLDRLFVHAWKRRARSRAATAELSVS
jgi:putative oxidoreductase